MERLIAWYRISSSVGAVVALVAANAVPLLGVLFFGWDVWTILIVYWLENGIFGVFNVLKMRKAEGDPDGVAATMRLNGRPVDPSSKAGLITFFIIHYGLFWVVHGVFVLTLPLFMTMGSASGVGEIPVVPFEEIPLDVPGVVIDDAATVAGTDPWTILVAVIALTISHGVSYYFNFVRGGEYRRVSAAGQMFAPYGRLVVLHITIIVGGMAIALTGAPEAAVAILVVLKTVLDVGFHLAAHRGVAAPATPGTVVEA